MTMKKLFFLFTVALLAVAVAQAQRVRFELQIEPAVEGEMKVYVQPRVDGEAKSTALRLKDGLYVGNIPFSGTGFYDIVLVNNNTQLMTTVYASDAKSVECGVEVKDRALFVSDTPDNRALSAFNATVAANARMLWTKPGMSNDEMKALIASYGNVADSLISAEKVSDPASGFIKVWAYTAAYDAYTSIPRAQNIDASEVGFELGSLLQPDYRALDNDYAPLFYSAYRIIAEGMPADVENLIDTLEILHNYYQNEAVRKMAMSKFISSFLSKHDYSVDYEGGLSILEKVTEIYGLSDEYINEYIKRKATIVGSPFPDDVVLEDADGNVVDISSFKGKYLYIDLWASWCGPCCKEVPYLQAIEKEFQDSNVVFLSISTDTDKEAWKNKMIELNMHGNQLHDRNNTLCNALNVKGIPFFLIYDKEGKLHTYKAMRPSRGDALRMVLEGLE